MNPNFEQYLSTIGIPTAIKSRVEEVCEFYTEICSEELLDIFISDYIKDDRSREYTSIWFFSETFGMEAKQFVTEDDFDITPLKDKIVYCDVKKSRYDFNEATDESRMTINFILNTGVNGYMQASGKNCDHMKIIANKYFMGNLVR